MPDAPHSVKVVAQVVDGVEDLGEYLVRRIEMTQVGARIAAANPAGTIGIERALVPCVACLLDRDFPLRCKEQSMPGGPRGQHTIHHVDSKLSKLGDFVWSTHPHQISRLVFG